MTQDLVKPAGALAADAARELDALGLDRDAPRVDRAEVVSSKSPTRCASAASSCASTAEPWKRRSVLNSLRALAHEALEGELAHVDFW